VSSAEPPLHRSYLFAPGLDPALMRKALRAGADAVVLDLEDGVAPERKDVARRAIGELLHAEDVAGLMAAPRAPELHVRINRDGTGYAAPELAMLGSPLVAAVRLPKAETADAVRDVSARLATIERDADIAIGTIRLYPTIESARGVLDAAAIAASDARVARLVFGQADLVADLGASGDDALATLVPRSLLVLASRAAGIGAPVDGAFTDLGDEDGLRAALARARALGMFGKSAIHPRQLPAIHATFTPDEQALARAARIVTAFDDAQRQGTGVTVLDGEMIDLPIVQRARGLLTLRRNP
jgi:citrate lyase subunit beta/citryl-CoA lyase